MRSLLKTVALSVALAIGAVASAPAATVTTTDTYALGGGNYSVSETVLPNAITATLTLFSGLGHLSVFAGGTSIFNDFIGPGFSRSFSFAAGTSLYASLSLSEFFLFGQSLFGPPMAEVVVTEVETMPDPVVPLPATAPLLLGAIAVAGAMARRRKAA